MTDSEDRLTQLVEEFGKVCKREKCRVNENKNKVMSTRVIDDRNGRLLDEVECYKYSESNIALGRIDEE